ncbi:MAG: XdhC family protein [Luminiphilus sp.]|nr:XdhC family protein [Luminiphilus sp.]
MQSQDQEVFEKLVEWLKNGDSPYLCTIVEAIGSSPRPVGSMLGCCGEYSVGTLSGGCVEEDLLEKLRMNAIDASTPQLIEYGVSAEENERLGLPCGGRLHILVQQLSPANADWVVDVVEALRARQSMARTTELKTGVTTIQVTEDYVALSLTQDSLTQGLGPKMQMLLVGAGQLAQVLAQLALAMDYEVLVTDTRDDVIAQWQGPEVELLHGLPDDIIARRSSDPKNVIVTLTHDPRIDDMALLEALETSAWYVGALGSIRTTRARLERLAALGVTETQLQRLHAPVGLDIGSKTPWEIAVAIMAEITQLRRKL